MELKQLEYFVQVAELGSFTRASAVLRVAQPALSRQVRRLEIELRQTLLIRNGRGVSTTEAGKRLPCQFAISARSSTPSRSGATARILRMFIPSADVQVPGGAIKEAGL